MAAPQDLEWWDEGDERLFLLTGGPGTGKSMILAWLACNARYHIDAPTMHRQIADHYWAKHHDDWSSAIPTVSRACQFTSVWRKHGQNSKNYFWILPGSRPRLKG